VPYFITDRHPDCPAWSVVKEDGELLACAESQDAAVEQMVAVSLAEDLEPGGTYEGDTFLPTPERATRDLPDNYRPATSEDVPEGRACGNCIFFNEDNVDAEGRAFCERWEEYVEGGFYCNAWEPREEERQEAEPAPASEQIEGSDENEPGSASDAGGDIELSERTETALRNKVSDHNEQMEEDGKPDYTRTTYGQLSAVYRTGQGFPVVLGQWLG